MTQRTLFGTDGIRGVANRHPMTPEIALQVGRAIARRFRNGGAPSVVIGKDTRLSGYLFENALTAGLLAEGANVLLVGPLPTPAVAHLTRSFAADAGIMITASHNPAEQNGIKLFDSQGYKLPDEQEAAIERDILDGLAVKHHDGGVIGKARRIDDARGRYIEFAKATIGKTSLKGLRIVLDCANGAAYNIAPTILRELGADIIVLNDEPDGLNINKGCGALHPDVIANAVTEGKADAGIALDGDADRLLLVDENGVVMDGDALLAILAVDLQARGTLAHDAVVCTEYTNAAFDEAMRRTAITVTRTTNGDRYVLEELRRSGGNLGGEQSGHLILLDHATTGDGTIAALHLLRILRESGKRLSALVPFVPYPQRVESRTVSEKVPLERLPKVRTAVAAAERLVVPGRVLVRYSGTEEKVRIMAEAQDLKKVDAAIKGIAQAFTEEGL